MNIDLSINIGISIGESICINTNIHMMMCIRRNTCSSITLYFLIRIPPDLEPKRGVALEDFPNSLWAGAEAVTDTRMQPKPKNKKPKVSRRMPEKFCCFGCLVVLFFVFLDFCFFVFFGFLVLHSETKKRKTTQTTKNQKSKTPTNQNTKKPKTQKTKTVPAFSVKLCFFVFFGLGLLNHRHVKLFSLAFWSRSSDGSTDTFGGL